MRGPIEGSFLDYLHAMPGDGKREGINLRALQRPGRREIGEEDKGYHSPWCDEWNGDKDTLKSRGLWRGRPDRDLEGLPKLETPPRALLSPFVQKGDITFTSRGITSFQNQTIEPRMLHYSG